MKVSTFEEGFQLNYISLVKVVQAMMSRLKAAEEYSVVFFSTVALKVGMPFYTGVAASKGAIEGFARSLAAEYAPKIRVNVIAPSLTNTSLAEKVLNNDVKREKMGKRHPLKRIGNPIDISGAAEFLLSSNSSWITGKVLGVDGGLSSINLQS